MTKKSSIQKAILKTLSDKKATSIDSVKEKVSKIVESKEIKTSQKSPKDSPFPQRTVLWGKSKTSYAISRSVKNLLSDGLIECFNSEHNQYFRLTNEGKQKLNNISIECESSLVSTKWDGFWRLIVLDLPEERKNEREALRYLLKKAGFLCVKNSVWISMYPFEHLFTNIKKDLGLSSEMMILVTNKIDEETEKEFFSVCGIK